MGSQSSEMAHVDTPISSQVLGGACDPYSGQPERCAPTTMGHIQEERDNISNGEHVKVRDERREQRPIARRSMRRRA